MDALSEELVVFDDDAFFGGDGYIDRSNRLNCCPSARSGYARAAYSDCSAGQSPNAYGHLGGGLRTYRSMLVESLLMNSKEGNLGVICVGDDSEIKSLGGIRDVGDPFGD